MVTFVERVGRVRAVQEDVGLFASVEGTIIYSIASTSDLPLKKLISSLTADTNSWVHHDDVMLVVFVKIAHQLTHLLEREALRIQREHTSGIHVVNICPHGL